MTQEVRITVDANLYYRNKERMDPAAASREWGYVLTKLIKDHAMADHKFVNVKVDIVPHDNDKDYTEEDAEKHLNGEKRKTYAEDYFEKFPNARKLDVLTDGGVKPVPEVSFADVYGEKKAEALRRKLNILFWNTLGDHFALWLAEMDDEI